MRLCCRFFYRIFFLNKGGCQVDLGADYVTNSQSNALNLLNQLGIEHQEMVQPEGAQLLEVQGHVYSTRNRFSAGTFLREPNNSTQISPFNYVFIFYSF